MRLHVEKRSERLWYLRQHMSLPLSHDLIADRYPDFTHRLGARSFHDLFGNDGEVFGIDFNGNFHSSGLRGLGLESSCRNHSTLAAAANNLPHTRLH